MSQGDKLEMEDVSSLKQDTASVHQLETTLVDDSHSEDEIFLDSFSAKEQNRIFRKVDFHIVPMLMLLYLFANLDRFVTPFVPSHFILPFLHTRNQRNRDVIQIMWLPTQTMLLGLHEAD